MASKERKSLVEKVAEVSKRIDVIMIGGGLVVFVFNPAVGSIIIIGSVLTFVPAEMISQSAKKKRQKKA